MILRQIFFSYGDCGEGLDAKNGKSWKVGFGSHPKVLRRESN
jgi:hypothetical protein